MVYSRIPVRAIFRLLALLLPLAFTCRSIEKKATVKAQQVTITNVASQDTTLQYDDDRLTRRYTNVIRNDRIGVWFTPPRVHDCSLYAVQYFFQTLMDTAQGFVSLVPRYRQNGDSLRSIGLISANFLIPPGTNIKPVTVILPKSVPINDTLDFFIGWVSDEVDTMTSPVGLADRHAEYNPPRSYRSRHYASHAAMIGLPYDLGVRAIFRCGSVAPDTGKFKFEMRWKQPQTDLDLYLIFPSLRDTVFWGKPTIGDSITLNVDDNDGYGPEKITCPCDAGNLASALIGVHYYGPSRGNRVQASVRVYHDSSLIANFGWCTLEPKHWWKVASIDFKYHTIVPADSCNRIKSPVLSARRKR